MPVLCWARVTRPDFNLLVVLDVVLAEQSVVRAAKKLKLSPSAMSRALARLRQTTGDPLLVQAGRGLVPSPRALELRDRVARLVHEANEVLQPGERLDLRRLERSFTLRTSEGFVENFGPALLARVAQEAPGVTLRFLPKIGKDSTLLRDGTVDLETGVIDDETGPELRAQTLFEDHLVGVVRAGHALARGKVTPARYAGCEHIAVSRRLLERGPIDEALQALGLQRRIAVVVGGFATAIAVARRSDLLATVPFRHSGVLLDGVHTFSLPIELPTMKVSLLWHPRLDADAAHRWLRICVHASVAASGLAERS
jgi:DNA-binding transcriptional LysR family regulator